MKKNKILKLLVITFVFAFIITGCGKKEEKIKDEFKEIKYKFVTEAYDLAETTTTYDITIKEKKIVIKYNNVVAHPELADGELPNENGKIVIEDEFFIEPLKKVFALWDKEQDLTIADNASLLISSLEKSQNREDDLCVVNGSWYCDIYKDVMDYNNDGKITVEENFSYYIHEIDPTITIIEDNRDNTIGKDEMGEKGLIPEKQASTTSKKYKTSEVANEFVLNGVPFKLGVDKVQKLLDNGFEFNKEPEKEITSTKQLFGSFKNYPDASITIVIQAPKIGEATAIEDCIIMSVDVKLAPNTANTFYWNFKNFKVNEHTTKTQINEYFDLAPNGSKTVYLYTEDFLIKLQCGSIYETHEYSNYYRVEAIEYNDNMTIPEWSK